jgi:hypothetical protein
MADASPKTPDPNAKLGERQYHAWYSSQQAEVQSRPMMAMNMYGNLVVYPYHHKSVIKPDGKRVHYTCISKTTDHGCMWTDMEYVGIISI